MLSGIDMEDVFVSASLLASWAVITTTSESSLPISLRFPSLLSNYVQIHQAI